MFFGLGFGVRVSTDNRNAEFIDEMIRDPVFADMLDDDGHGHGHDHGHDHSHDHTHNHPSTHSHQPKTPKERLSQGGSDLAQDKVRSTLRSMVRDWAKEGAKEREACYDPIIKVLESTFPDKRGEKKVLVPGCGLGRLAMEIASKGECTDEDYTLTNSSQDSSHRVMNSQLIC